MGRRDYSRLLLEEGITVDETFVPGGAFPVRGWDSFDWEDKATLFRRGLREESPIHESFDDVKEVKDFVLGSGKYEERNSFFYNEDEMDRLYSEIFPQDLHCPECLEESLEGGAEDFMDSRILPEIYVDEIKSFKPEEDKYQGELWYQCKRHPEVYLMQSETWYEDTD